jgi:hypothetical protein
MKGSLDGLFARLEPAGVPEDRSRYITDEESGRGDFLKNPIKRGGSVDKKRVNSCNDVEALPTASPNGFTPWTSYPSSN